MAITFKNQTICQLCGKEIKSNEHFFSFPVFVQNIKDPFYLFNDSSFHLNCLNFHPLGKKAKGFAEEFFLKTSPGNRICEVGGNEIKNFDDYIFIDLLTSNEQEDLYKFNFTTLDKNNLKNWEARNKFIAVATKFLGEGKWIDSSSFKYLNHLINRIEGKT